MQCNATQCNGQITLLRTRRDDQHLRLKSTQCTYALMPGSSISCPFYHAHSHSGFHMLIVHFLSSEPSQAVNMPSSPRASHAPDCVMGQGRRYQRDSGKQGFIDSMRSSIESMQALTHSFLLLTELRHVKTTKTL